MDQATQSPLPQQTPKQTPPTPQQTPPQTPQKVEIQKELTFPEAIKELANGKKIHKLEWEDKEYYGVLDDEKVKLHKPEGTLHMWTISMGDLIGEDWIIL